MADEGRQAVVAAFLGNLALTVVKGIAAALSGSAAMLAETLHSIADMGNEALLFLGMRLAKRPPDAVHPLGHGRDMYFWAFVVSGLLFSVGGCFAIWEAVRTFLNPETHVSYRLNYAVLAGAFVFESASLAIGLRSFVLEMGSKPLRNYLRDLRDPTVLVVVLAHAPGPAVAGRFEARRAVEAQPVGVVVGFHVERHRVVLQVVDRLFHPAEPGRVDHPGHRRREVPGEPEPDGETNHRPVLRPVEQSSPPGLKMPPTPRTVPSQRSVTGQRSVNESTSRPWTAF